MRHLNGLRKLGRNSSHRTAMFKNMVTSLLRHGQITTTEPKAKELRRIVEKVITLSKNAALESAGQSESVEAAARRVHAIRLARRWVTDRDVLTTLFGEYGPRFRNRAGGYTRIVKLGYRAGDNAPMSCIQLLSGDA